MPTLKRKSPFDSTTVADFPLSDSPAPTTKKPRKAPTPKGVVGTCSLNKKELGDRIKECFALEKYSLNRTVIRMDMDLAYFKSFFGNNPAIAERITPPLATISSTTPVAVLDLGNAQAGELLGVSKIKGGNRIATVDMYAMQILFYPTTSKAVVWVSV
jgi:hypothetical protein